jgi:hypothetical protein
MLDKVTRWVLCLPDNTVARYEGHVPFLPLQPSSNRNLIRNKQGEVCFLWPEHSYTTQTNKMHTFEIDILIEVFNFLRLLHVSNLMGSFS